MARKPGSDAAHDARAARGLGSHHAGMAAEDAVARHYQHAGGTVVARRWRGESGEIDLIIEAANGMLVFVEVKHAATHARAAEYLKASQAKRIMQTAAEYLAATCGHLDVDMRFDLALADRLGQVEVIENAFMT